MEVEWKEMEVEVEWVDRWIDGTSVYICPLSYLVNSLTL